MAQVGITLKLSAGEFQTLRAELDAHIASLRAGAEQARKARNLTDARQLTEREAATVLLGEKLG